MQDLCTELYSFKSEEFDEDHRRTSVAALKTMENGNLFTNLPEAR